MNLNSLILEETRLNICKSCPFYNENNTCQYIIEKTARVGALYHASGIRNPYSRCPHPDRYWYSITSYHAWYIDRYLFPLDRELRHNFTKHGVGRINALGIVNLIYDHYSNNNLPAPVKRSVLLQEIKDLAKSLNGYQHLDKQRLKVNYVTGDLT